MEILEVEMFRQDSLIKSIIDFQASLALWQATTASIAHRHQHHAILSVPYNLFQNKMVTTTRRKQTKKVEKKEDEATPLARVMSKEAQKDCNKNSDDISPVALQASSAKKRRPSCNVDHHRGSKKPSEKKVIVDMSRNNTYHDDHLEETVLEEEATMVHAIEPVKEKAACKGNEEAIDDTEIEELLEDTDDKDMSHTFSDKGGILTKCNDEETILHYSQNGDTAFTSRILDDDEVEVEPSRAEVDHQHDESVVGSNGILKEVAWFSKAQNKIFHHPTHCAAGQHCCEREGNLPKTLLPQCRCATCFCCVHQRCSHPLTATKMVPPEAFKFICAACVIKLKLPLRFPPPGIDKDVLHVSERDKEVKTAFRIMHYRNPPIIEFFDPNNPTFPADVEPAREVFDCHTAGQKQAEGPLNLQCFASIQAHYPKGYKKFKPINPYRVSVEKFNEWCNMTREQQISSKHDWKVLSATRKDAVTQSIPGEKNLHCVCSSCNRKPRKDKGKQRRTSTGTGSDGSYVSERDIAETREGGAAAQRKKTTLQRRKGQSRLEVPDFAKTVQQQVDKTAMRELQEAMVQMQRTLTAALNPNVDGTPQLRFRGLMTWEIEVNETPVSGGRLAESDLRRKQPLLIRMSTNKADWAHLLTVVVDPKHKESREVHDFFVPGEEGMKKVKQFIAEDTNAGAKNNVTGQGGGCL
ncbi:hypothetical protein IV203_005052 [Nitzschia inconspicua]|uniref:Uncharacterized protein n=1 Tax=Nitzschia inconspicua TaxID=303405 RepID=A0A9K3PG40_9STRA|nr:hypothetical protein IV203_005052 [Nitzschia inconspicua]